MLCVDVHYEEQRAVAAGVGFRDWPDADSALEVVVPSELAPEPYEPGAFYKRELFYLLDLVDLVRRREVVEVVVVDGHVWLEAGRAGLGAHLHRALGSTISVVGVAKSMFRGGEARPVVRGESQNPLFVTSEGIEVSKAAEYVCGMHGPYRIPTLLKRVDQLARGNVEPVPAKSFSIGTG